MKKLLYSGLTALMLLFAIGFAQADNAKVKVELNPTTWTIGATAPQFTVTITQATTETGGGEATTAEGDALTLGASAGNVAVKVTLSKDGTNLTQTITETPVALTTTGLTAGTWTLAYDFVKGEDQSTTFENVDNDASTASLTVEAAPVTETTDAPTFKVSGETKTAYELAADEASVTVTIVAATGADVYYTTNGDDPTTTTTTTGTSVTINSACTLKAIAVETGKNASAVAYFEVTKATAPVVEKVAAPTFSPVAGAVEANTMVTINTTTSEAKVYYRKETKLGGYEEYTEPVAITEGCTLYAYAAKEGMTNSDTIDAEYTIVALPEDDKDAPVLTFMPVATDSVDNNTEIEITGIPEGATLYYALCESVAEAVESIKENKETPIQYLEYFMETYGVKYPAVTSEAPVLLAVLVNNTDKYVYCRKYKVREASDVTMPMIMSENAMAIELGLYPKGDKIKIVAGDMDAIWYTTDGSKPAINGATSTKINGDAGDYTLNASTTIKAIAVKDGKASDVAVARFKLIRDAMATIKLQTGMGDVDSIIGKNSPLNISINCPESPDMIPSLPYTVYYTTDGSEPSAEAYTGEGSIKKAEPVMAVEEYDDEVYSYMAGPASILIDQTCTLKAKAYVPVVVEGDVPGKYELNDTVVTQLFVYEIDSVMSALDPEFSLAGIEVRIGDTLRIKNPNLAPVENEDGEEYSSQQPSQIYFSLNGPLPVSGAEQAEPQVVYTTDNQDFEEEVIIVFKEDEKGTYAEVPSNEKYLGWACEDCNKIYFDGELKIQAICYDAVVMGENPMTGWPALLQYGSNFVEATYMVMKDFPMPVITPNGGELAKDAEITITAGAGLDIYYTTNDSIPNIDSAYTKKYEAPIKMVESMTVKAMAYKAGAEGERDSVSNVAEAKFRLQATLNFNPASGSTVEEGTKVEITASDDDVEIFYMMFESEAAAKAAEWDQEKAESYNDELQPVLTPKKNTIKAAYARQGADAIVEAYFYATYTVTELPDITLTFNPASGSEVKDSTEITVTASRETEILYLVYVDSAASVADTLFDRNAKEVAEDGKPMITKGNTFLKCAVYNKGEIKYFFASYTVKDEESAIEAAELAGVNVYPNPNAGAFNVAVPERALVEIFGLNGAKVMSREVNAGVEAFNLDHSGIYFIRVMAGNKTAVKRVVVR